MEIINMKSAGVFSTIGSILSGIQSTMEGTAEVSQSYMQDWRESRELNLAGKRFERDVEWMKLGQTIQNTSFDDNAIQLAKSRYGNK